MREIQDQINKNATKLDCIISTMEEVHEQLQRLIGAINKLADELEGVKKCLSKQ